MKDETDDEIFERMKKVADKAIGILEEDSSPETIQAVAQLVDNKMRDMLVRHGYLKLPKLH